MSSTSTRRSCAVCWPLKFPRWAELAIERIEPTGTDTAIYRLGDDMVVRLPRVARTVATLEKLSQALNALSYYTLETNAVLVREARRWLTEVLADHPLATR
jgi:hypothetical protein